MGQKWAGNAAPNRKLTWNLIITNQLLLPPNRFLVNLNNP